MSKKSQNQMPIVSSCDGCGVCCFHMGYPAFMLPRKPVSPEQVVTDVEFQKLVADGWTEQELIEGTPGEKYWHQLPEHLKTEWHVFVANYKAVEGLDGPCFWLNMETKMCKHHEYRPRVCRDFDVGSQVCLEWRREYGIE